MILRVDTVDRSTRLARRWKHNMCTVTVMFLFLLGIFYALTAIGRTTKRVGIRSLDGPCWQVVDEVRKAQIQLVAFDFDATVIDIHTGGRWKGSAEELATHVRTDMRCFIERCIDNKIQISVATFSTQTRLISQVLELTIGRQEAKAIPVFGDRDRVDHFDQGKQSQLLLSMNHYNQMRNQRSNPITPASTLLVDDDADNIRVARADGFNTMLYQPGREIGTMELLRP